MVDVDVGGPAHLLESQAEARVVAGAGVAGDADAFDDRGGLAEQRDAGVDAVRVDRRLGGGVDVEVADDATGAEVDHGIVEAGVADREHRPLASGLALDDATARDEDPAAAAAGGGAVGGVVPPGSRVRICVPYGGTGGNGGALIGGSQTVMARPRAQAVASVRQSCVVRVSSGVANTSIAWALEGSASPR